MSLLPLLGIGAVILWATRSSAQAFTPNPTSAMPHGLPPIKPASKPAVRPSNPTINPASKPPTKPTSTTTALTRPQPSAVTSTATPIADPAKYVALAKQAQAQGNDAKAKELALKAVQLEKAHQAEVARRANLNKPPASIARPIAAKPKPKPGIPTSLARVPQGTVPPMLARAPITKAKPKVAPKKQPPKKVKVSGLIDAGLVGFSPYLEGNGLYWK